MNRLSKTIAYLLVMFFFPGMTYSAEISGVPVISDGDTLKIWSQGIRLEGIDAPETAQTCKKKNGVNWKCGEAAANYLQKITSGKKITCKGTETDDYKRLIATCFMDSMDINQRMVESGMAVAYIEYSDTYITQERNAQQLNKGIWDTEFVRPAAFRSSEWQRDSPQPEDQGDCKIKGNINNKGVKIYHTPWSRHYDRTKITASKGERWFCTEAEALEAGWRAPYR